MYEQYKYHTERCKETPITEKRLKELGKKGWKMTGCIIHQEYLARGEFAMGPHPKHRILDIHLYYFVKEIPPAQPPRLSDGPGKP
jgi:hypothetical protein